MGYRGDLVNLSWVLVLLVKSGSEDNLKGIQFKKHLMKTYLPLRHLISTMENSEFKDFWAQHGKWEEKKLAIHGYLLSQALCLEFTHDVFHPRKNMWVTASLTFFF